MSTRPNALGRGLGALLPGAPTTTSDSPLARREESRSPRSPSGEAALSEQDAVGRELPVASIRPNPEQPRRSFDAEAIDALADSIRQYGVLQPVVVREAGDGYELVVGERRWRASRQAGLEKIPAVVADVDAKERLEVALVENVQRRDLNPIELAHAFQTLADGGATQEEIGGRVGLDRSTVANHVRLLELPREIQGDVEEGRLGVGHAKALLGISNPERRRHLRDRVVRDGLSVRAAEELSRSAPGAQRKHAPRRAGLDPNLQRVIDQLRQHLQTRVRIQGDAGRGRIEIEYFGADDLNRLTGMLLGDA